MSMAEKNNCFCGGPAPQTYLTCVSPRLVGKPVKFPAADFGGYLVNQDVAIYFLDGVG